jgi:hypothetical protein
VIDQCLRRLTGTVHDGAELVVARPMLRKDLKHTLGRLEIEASERGDSRINLSLSGSDSCRSFPGDIRVERIQAISGSLIKWTLTKHTWVTDVECAIFGSNARFCREFAREQKHLPPRITASGCNRESSGLIRSESYYCGARLAQSAKQIDVAINTALAERTDRRDRLVRDRLRRFPEATQRPRLSHRTFG